LLSGKGLFDIKYDVKTPWNVAQGTGKTFSQNAPTQISKQFTNANMDLGKFTNAPVTTGKSFAKTTSSQYQFTNANLGKFTNTPTTKTAKVSQPQVQLTTGAFKSPLKAATPVISKSFAKPVASQFTNANMKLGQFTNKPVATGTSFTTPNLGFENIIKKQAAPATKKQAAPASVANRFTSANVGIGTFKPTGNVVGNSNFAANVGGMVKGMAKPTSRKSIKKMVGLKRKKNG